MSSQFIFVFSWNSEKIPCQFFGWTDRHNGKNKIYKLCEYYYNLHFISLKNCNTLHKETSFEFKHFRFENLDQMDFLYFLIHVGLSVDYRYMYICEYLHVFTVKTQYINTHSWHTNVHVFFKAKNNRIELYNLIWLFFKFKEID